MKIILGMVLFVLLGVVGQMDFQDEVAEADRYCSNVYQGQHPDYRGIADSECIGPRHYLAKDSE